MALEDYVLPTAEVQLPDGKNSFAVRGLSLEDVALLISDHGAALEGFYGKYSGSSSAEAMAVGMSLIGQAPILAAQIIAIGADSREKVDLIRKLPIVVQQDALEKIARLTFDASGGPGKFIEAVLRLVKGTTDLMSTLAP